MLFHSLIDGWPRPRDQFARASSECCLLRCPPGPAQSESPCLSLASIGRGSTRPSPAATKLVCLAFSLRPWRLGGDSVGPHSPPRRKERQEFRQAEFFPGEQGFSVY